MAILSEHLVSYASDKKKLYYVAAGPIDGPLLIFLHGWPGIARTWLPQLTVFAALGFRVVAPDMPGYGNSTSNKVYSDYSMQTIVEGMLAMLADLGREDAVWVAHDWGCGVLWSLVAVHPKVCRGAIGMAVPYGVLELGVQEAIKYVNRQKYPVSEFPHGQWSYQIFYEQHFEKATAWSDQDAASALRATLAKGSPRALEKPSPLAYVMKDGGRMGGTSGPPPKSTIAPGKSSLDGLPDDVVLEFEQAMTRTGFFGANAYYMNHQANREYILRDAVNDRVVDLPVLFIEAKYDSVLDTADSRLAEPMKKLCKDLTYTSIDAGHWVALEKPEETNAAMARWLVEKLPSYWPGFWSNAFAGSKL